MMNHGFIVLAESRGSDRVIELMQSFEEGVHSSRKNH
jgi:hypothetical protein